MPWHCSRRSILLYLFRALFHPPRVMERKAMRTFSLQEEILGHKLNVRKVGNSRTCWMEHMKLTSLQDDPEDIHLRASSGLGTTDYFMTGYYLWG